MNTEKSLYGKGRVAAMCVAIAIVSVISIRPMMAQTEAAILKFTAATGAKPLGGLIVDSADNLYGVTTIDGPSAAGYGTVFELSPPASGDTWALTILYEFLDRNDGKSIGPLAMDKSGNLYGTTIPGKNPGTVYEVSPPALAGGPWTKTTLYGFKGAPDASIPAGGLVIDAAGNLYGTTWAGGTCNLGAAFEVSPPAASGADWTEKVIYSFGSFEPSCSDKHGTNPGAGMAMDKDGALYGTSTYGGTTGKGTVFELTPPAADHPDWMEKVLYNFTGSASDGAYPSGAMVLYRGNLYGTALYGVNPGCPQYSECGTVFELSPPSTAGDTWNETLLYDFDGGADGANPNWNVLFDKEGNLYTTASDGGNAGCGPGLGCGTVIKLVPPAVAGNPWTETTLYDFSPGADGSVNPSGLVIGKFGRLYGTTYQGGDADCRCGVVFKIIP